MTFSLKTLSKIHFAVSGVLPPFYFLEGEREAKALKKQNEELIKSKAALLQEGKEKDKEIALLNKQIAGLEQDH